MPDLQNLRRTAGARISAPLVRILGQCPVSANAITICGFLVTLVAAWLASEGLFPAAGLVLIGAALFDLLDGALARVKGTTSRFGAILDSTSDRLSEAVLFVGIALWFLKTGDTIAILATYVALISSFLVSYVRARGEAMGLECTVGLCTRPERVIVLVLGLLTGFVFVAVSIVALLASITVLQRLLHLHRMGKESGD